MAKEVYFCPHCKEELIYRLGQYECPACDYVLEKDLPPTPRSARVVPPSRLESVLRGTPPMREMGDPEPLRKQN